MRWRQYGPMLAVGVLTNACKRCVVTFASKSYK